MNSFYKIGFLIVFYLSAILSNAQYKIDVLLLDANNFPVSYVKIKVLDTGYHTYSNVEGKASLDLPELKSYFIQFSCIGYVTVTKKLEPSSIKTKMVVINMVDSLIELDTVSIKTKTRAEEVEESPYVPVVILLKPYRNSSLSTSDILNQAPGVRIRQHGGAGSSISPMLGGIDGKGVQVFLDGIPISLLGHGYSINTISPSLIDRFEIYKGLIPVRFGSDALGGVINMVSRKIHHDYAEVSYNLGSWNSHQLTFSTQKRWGNTDRFYLNVDGFYNKADNDYVIDDVDVKIDDLGNTKKSQARRFHDGYKSYLGRFQMGAYDFLWSDRIKIIGSVSSIEKDWQHGFIPTRPWGEAYSKYKELNLTLSWDKFSKKDDRWQISIVAGGNISHVSFIDTSSKVFYWDGSYITKNHQGESGFFSHGRTPDFLSKKMFFRKNTLINLTDHFTLNVNLLTSYEYLTGEDKGYQQSKNGQDPFKEPQKLFKNFIGTSLENKLFNEKVIQIFSAKHYFSSAYAVGYKVDNSLTEYESSKFSNFAYGYVFKWNIFHKLKYTVGYEKTVRLPDSEELFGNYIEVRPNPTLSPEVGHNVNGGLTYTGDKTGIKLNTFFFFRKVTNRIFQSSVSYSSSAYLNLLGVTVNGLETSVQVPIKSSLLFQANLTYQRLELSQIKEEGKIHKRYLGAIIPNTPYFFNNVALSYSFDPFKNISFKMHYEANYVHEFFLTWATDGKKESKDIIPSQLTHNFSLTCSTPSERYNLSLTLNNLTNIKAYDYFSVQKPGRNIQLKLRLFLTKNVNKK